MSQSLDVVTTDAFSVIVQRRDGVGFATTSNDRRQSGGAVATETDLDLSPEDLVLKEEMFGSSLRLRGGSNGLALATADLLSGRWTGAGVQLLAGDWSQDDEQIPLCEGAIRHVAIESEILKIAVDVLPDATRLAPCIQTSPECRAVLGDKDCRVDLRARSIRVRIVAVEEGAVVVDAADTERFAMGRLRWISGSECGCEARIMSAIGSELSVQGTPLPSIQAGDRAIITEGCDGRRSTCSERFANVQNFRGEPDLPGSRIMLRYPGA